MPEGNMESLATSIRLVTLNCRLLSSELQQAVLTRHLRYLHASFAALQETRTRDCPLISIDNYTIYCGDATNPTTGRQRPTRPTTRNEKATRHQRRRTKTDATALRTHPQTRPNTTARD
ncbi:hypothetical protein RB195_019300 [Necator americanus]